jgi:uncharacterized membrane protein
MESQPTDAMMGFVWVLAFLTIGAMKAYHAAWVVKSHTHQRNRYIILAVMQVVILACVVWGMTLGNFSDYKEAVNSWGDLTWVFKITTGMTLATPLLTALVGWQIHRHPVKPKRSK